MQKISGSFFGHNLCPVWPEKNCQMSIKVDNFTKNAKECGIFGQINCRRKFNKSPNLVTLCVPLIFGPTYFVGWHYLKLMCLKFCVIPYCVTLTSPLHLLPFCVITFLALLQCSIILSSYLLYCVLLVLSTDNFYVTFCLCTLSVSRMFYVLINMSHLKYSISSVKPSFHYVANIHKRCLKICFKC